MTSELLLEARGVTVNRDGREVLHDIDLELRDGEVTALVGPNGAGKSTLLSALAGLVKPSSGTVSVHGSIATALQAPGLARRSAQANVEAALGWWGAPRAERRDRATGALAALHASHLADRRATQLSGGEQRRIHLARALALDPDILLLDEPFAGLDPGTRSLLLEDATSALRARRGTTLVVVHDRAEAWALADRMIVLMDGVVAGAGAGQDLLDAPPSAEVARFLGYDGEIRRDGVLLLTRARHIVLDADGEQATVDRVVAVEDGFRLRLLVTGGVAHAFVSGAPPELGQVVRVRIDGGASFAVEKSVV